MFWLKKVIGYWLMPLPFCLLLCALGLWLLWRNRQSWTGRFAVTVSFLLLFLFSNRGVSTWLIQPFVSAYPAIAEITAGRPAAPEVASCHYIIVLGGGHTDSDLLPARSKLSIAGLDRLSEGVRLAHALPHAILLVSGPSAGTNLPTHASVLARAAESLGIDPLRIRMIDTARDTEDEARAVRAIAGDDRVLLVTSAWHMTRAAALFRKNTVNFIPAPTDYGTPAARSPFARLGCDVESLNRSTFAVREHLGLLWARLTGKISPS